MKRVIRGPKQRNRRVRKSVKQAEYLPIEAHEAFQHAQIMNGAGSPLVKEVGGDERELVERVLSGDCSDLADRPIVGAAPKERLLGRPKDDGSADLMPFKAYEAWWKENGRPREGAVSALHARKATLAEIEQHLDELDRKIQKVKKR